MLSATRLPTGARPFTANRAKAVVCQAKFSPSIVQEIAKDQMKPNPPKVVIGDTVKFGLAVVEGKGKTRTQKLEATVIAEHGSGLSKTVTFRRIFQGVGVELTVPLHSPSLQTVELVRSGKVRRAKLYYLRDRVGKAAKLKEIVGAAAAKRRAEHKAAQQ